MNTRRRLRRLFEAVGMVEEELLVLDDCRTFSRFRVLLWCELVARRILRGVGLVYPERCVLGVYAFTN